MKNSDITIHHNLCSFSILKAKALIACVDGKDLGGPDWHWSYGNRQDMCDSLRADGLMEHGAWAPTVHGRMSVESGLRAKLEIALAEQKRA